VCKHAELGLGLFRARDEPLAVAGDRDTARCAMEELSDEPV
jgi:hypothetical protein